MALPCEDDFSVNCDECYEVSRADDDLTFDYGLTPLTNYYLFVIDKFRNVYSELITTDGSGAFTINPSSVVFPNGMFNQYAGDFEVFLATDSEGANVVSFTLYATVYNCLILSITSSSNIDCTPYNPIQGCDPATVFDGASTVSVESGGTYTCTAGGSFNMIVNENGIQIFSEVWDADDTNTINVNLQ